MKRASSGARKGIINLFNRLSRFFRRKHHTPSPIRVAAGVKAGVTRKRRERFDAALTEVERYLHITSYRVNKRGFGTLSGLHHTRQRDFNHAEPWLLIDALPEFYPLESSLRKTIRKNCRPNDLVRPLDVRILGNWLSDTGDEKLPEKATLQRFRQATLNDVRGRVSSYMPYMIEHRMAFIDPIKNQAEPYVMYVGTYDFVHWHIIGRSWRNEMLDDDWSTKFKVALGIAESRQDKWLISIQQENSAALLLPTDPVGVREIFRFRDLPDGRKRRASLIHWVEGHYRQYHDDPGAITYVRKHLRGKTLFSWNGMRCMVRPPIIASEFSQRPDLVAVRDEAQGSDPATIPVESLRLKTAEEMAMDALDIQQDLIELHEGRKTIMPANKAGTWVTIE
jgi:hypothetical protein